MTGRSFGQEAWFPMARALVAHASGESEAVLSVYVDEGEADPMDVSLFFRSPQELREVDRTAIAMVRGRVLDVGAGVGSIALALQAAGVEVTAVEVIPEAVEIMTARGVQNARLGRVQELPKDRIFDTLLLLMNGVALAGTLAALPAFLQVLDGLLAPHGQIILDSTDMTVKGGEAREGPDLRAFGQDQEDYPGEFQYQLEFEGARGAPFPQLFVDPATLEAVAEGEGFRTDVFWRGEEGEYLARLTRG